MMSAGSPDGFGEATDGRLRHAKQLIEELRIEYNTERPHSSLGYLTPAQFARAHDAKQ
ncbi:integrase core domain-containing protein [Burkholderia contaminans]|uniref:integrase core domain-containing protein n=1 Tax=Burkholderia contaminans TaxID=488447 RepID=UPI0012603738